ncbi:MAG TPA: hypothetical protein VM260_01945 [Pirellula sp.]|nr:hypothetical protein [Pirellula sp.]
MRCPNFEAAQKPKSNSLKPGVVYGATDENGMVVWDHPINQRRLFATIYANLVLNPNESYELPGFPMHHRVEAPS